MQARFSRWVRTSTPRGCEIVIEILKSSYPATLHSRDIYNRVLKDYSQEKVLIPPPLRPPPFGTTNKSEHCKECKPPPEPPHPDHPIRSYTYLKSVILADMARRDEIRKVHSMRDPTPEELARKNERPSKLGKKNKRSSGPPLPPLAFNVKGMIDQWGWTIKTADDLDAGKREQLRVQKATDGQKLLDTKRAEKEKRRTFEEQWGHLNVRRQRAREGKLKRDEVWASVLERGRQAGRTAAEQATS